MNETHAICHGCQQPVLYEKAVRRSDGELYHTGCGIVSGVAEDA